MQVSYYDNVTINLLKIYLEGYFYRILWSFFLENRKNLRVLLDEQHYKTLIGQVGIACLSFGHVTGMLVGSVLGNELRCDIIAIRRA